MSLPHINKIILGTVQLGLDYGINNTRGKPSSEQALQILQSAYSNGIQTLDTAEAYGNAHEIIGNYHRQNSSQRFEVITKCNAETLLASKTKFKDQLIRNLDELEVDRLNSYLFHSFEQYQQFEHWDILETFLAQDKIGKIGVSVYFNNQVNAVAEDSRIGLVQLPFNLLDNNSYRGMALSILKEHGKEVHTRSVFLQGLFFKDRESLGKLYPLKESLLKLDILSGSVPTDIGTLALGYTLHQSCIDKVLIGIETEKQLQHNFQMLSNVENIPTEIYDAIDHVVVENSNLLIPTNW